MEFCDECGNLMLAATVDGKKVFKCKCGAVKELSEEKTQDYKIRKKIEHSPRDEVTNSKQITEWKDKNLRSTISNFKCRHCGYTKAQLETRQTRSADEGMTHFIICLGCGNMFKIGS